MTEQIGKYRVLERIGRGGMGMIFKAHDPVLDRPVALKVISSEVEVTEELRARFFREAQACARLSHPNIVTLYDMGEDNGRIYIVMELLDGEELRRFITHRKTLSLEDKLAIMVQVCAGLHYAHQKRIVHRDIKPGNIMVLRSGQVKILDFGIAQIATTEGGLTRTGLIVGTLRYMAPEQGQGRADYRSDIFSAGAVFYELLSSQPPWSGEDPMQMLEQIRTQEPASLTAIDPTIPSKLAAIVERALQKDPKDRFSDLGQMHSQIEQVQRSLAEERQKVRARLLERRTRLQELQAALAERIGPPKEPDTVLAVDERAGLAALQGLERDLERRIERLQARIARADALAPAVQRCAELLSSERFTDAVAEFESVVAEMPDHARALDGLAHARAQAEVQRGRQLGAQLVQEAHTALRDGGRALPPAELAQEIETLRQAAEAGQASQDTGRLRAARERTGARASPVTRSDGASPRGRQLVERVAPVHEGNGVVARDPEAPARRAHLGARGPRYLAFSLAVGSLLALVGYWVVASFPRGPGVETLRSQALDACERAAHAEAATLAPDVFSAAQATAADGERLAAARNVTAAAQAYREAAERYDQAERNAQIKREQRVEANEARDRMATAKQRGRPASGDFATALVREQEGTSMYERLAFKDAATNFRAAAELFAKVPPPQDPSPGQDPRPAQVPRPPVQDPRAEIRALLNGYVRAVETKDLGLLRRVRSGLTEDELRRLRASFEITRSHKVDLRVYEIRVTGDEAEALGRREDVVVLNSGQRLSTETRFVYTLKRGTRGWVIHGIRESAERSAGPQPPPRPDSTSSRGVPDRSRLEG
jgi:hypothetical protein